MWCVRSLVIELFPIPRPTNLVNFLVDLNCKSSPSACSSKPSSPKVLIRRPLAFQLFRPQNVLLNQGNLLGRSLLVHNRSSCPSRNRNSIRSTPGLLPKSAHYENCSTAETVFCESVPPQSFLAASTKTVSRTGASRSRLMK